MKSTRGRRVSLTMLAGGAASFLMAGVMAAGPATADKGGNAGAPNGNNGTIKIGEYLADDTPTTNANDPKVGCPFQLSLFNFDSGTGITNTATVNFEAWPPSGKFIPLVATGPANPIVFSTAKWSDSYTFGASELAKMTAGPQGYHVKVSVSVTTTGIVKGKSDAAPGHDSTPGNSDHGKTLKKHKVFWVTCTPPTPTQSSSAPVVTPTSASPTSAVLPTSAVVTPTPSPSTTVLGEKVTRKPAPAKVTPTKTDKLPMTGTSDTTRVLLPAGLGLVLTGAGLIGLTRRTRVAQI
jgi:hypothetical protein